MNFAGATQEQLDIINSLSSQEVDMLIGLKTRLNSVATEGVGPEARGNTGYFVW
jgi:hypothetical protein